MSLNDKCKPFKKHPCSSKIRIQKGSKILRGKLQKAKECCDEEEFKEINKYFHKGTANNEDLLKALRNYYKNKKDNDINFTLSMNQFIQMFPRDTSLKDNNFKRQHIFEQLCRLLLFFNYDNGLYGTEKEFYKKLEDYNSTTKGLTKKKLLEEKINEGSKAGSVDIFFKLDEDGKKPNTNDFYCNKKKDETHNEKNTFILVQNKYYTNESSDIAKYDAPKILARASQILDKVDKFKIVLMVNSRKILDSKLKSYDKEGLDILGVEDIEPWFQKFLQDLYSNDISKFTESKIISFKKLEPRFHQKLFIDSSLRHHNDKKKRKFIWGAVPRSGKSYMIGGMISRRAELGSDNDIIIIMGAKSETEGQFKDLLDFKNGGDKFIDFKDFNFSTPDKVNEGSGKNIYIMSQEFFKMNKLKLSKTELDKLKKLINKTNRTPIEETELKEIQKQKNIYDNKPYEFKPEIKKKFPKLFKKDNKIDIYFDEIHKGGSTDKSKEILQSFINENMVDLLFMVTATFAKPSIAYEGFLDDQTPVILQWGYEEQQLMKSVDTNEINLQIVKEQRNNAIDKEIIDQLLIEYNKKYGIDYLRILADEYKKHPELVLLNPLAIDEYKTKIGNLFETRDLGDTIFSLSCDAVDYTNQANLGNIEKIFQKSSHVEQLLNFLTSDIGLYNYLEHEIDVKMKLKVFDTKPTQLWFLPITGLFKDNICTPKGIDGRHKEDADIEQDDDETSEKKQGVPHIEPITRGIALALMKNDKFRANYNVLIVHNDGKLFDKSKIKSDSINCVSQEDDTKDSLVDKIKNYENLARDKNKGLIILTGTKLRLGVSLPCADIALNFDNVQSIDSNYQTMFRVLTERKDSTKKYGYYIDFNLDRTKSFIYNFALIYSNKLKHNNSFGEIKESLSNIYELFNFNGMSFSNAKDFKGVLNMYKSLNDRLGITDENLKIMYLKNYERIIGKIMLKYDISKLNEINKLIKGLFKGSSNIKDVIKGANKKGGKKFNTSKNTVDDEDEDEDEDDEIEEGEIDDDISIVNNLKIFLPIFVALLSLFSSKSPEKGSPDFNCEKLDDCLDKAIESIEPLHAICDCKSEPNLLHPIGCYIKKFKDLKPKELLKLLNNIKKVIFTGDGDFVELRQHLNLLYNNIRMDFSGINKKTQKMKGGGGINKKTQKMRGGGRKIKMKGGTKKLINNMDNQEIMSKIEQYLPIRKEMKDKHGEVFTPYVLIKEMMDK